MYRVVWESFSGSAKFHQSSQLNIYTDGSWTHDRTGTGYSIFEGTNEYDTGSFTLPEYSTVFQAKLVAILLAACHVLREARSLRPRYIKIFSNFQSAIAALAARHSSCRTVRDTISAPQQPCTQLQHGPPSVGPLTHGHYGKRTC